MNLLTELELAHKLGKNRATISRWRMLGQIKPDKSNGHGFGARYIYSWDNIKKQLKAAGKYPVDNQD